MIDFHLNNIALSFLVPFLIVFIFIIFIWYRRKRENEFKQQVAAVEMKALRAQINPHFIFNCMNSVNNFMMQNNAESASTYLIKFATLIRQILENSEHSEVTLEKDLETLDLYIQMEQLRVSNGFDYTIKTDDAIDIRSTKIPPMLLQPFIENSIWHGLSNKETKGNLRINASVENNMLKFTIDDDGTEVKLKEHSILYKKKSMGMSLTNERLEVYNKLKNANAHFKLSDLRDEREIYKGKRVEVWLPMEPID